MVGARAIGGKSANDGFLAATTPERTHVFTHKHMGERMCNHKLEWRLSTRICRSKCDILVHLIDVYSKYLNVNVIVWSIEVDHVTRVHRRPQAFWPPVLLRAQSDWIRERSAFM